MEDKHGFKALKSKSWTNIRASCRKWDFYNLFSANFFLQKTTLVTELKSTLLLMIRCFDTAIYMKTQCLQTNET
jgi:hypothetical protein